MPVPDETQDQAEAPQAKRRLPLKKMLIVMVIVLVVGGGGAAAYYKSSPALQEKVGFKLPQKEEKHTLVDLGTIVVNLADIGSTRYLKIGLHVSVPEKAAEEVHANEVQIKDCILQVLRAKTAAEVLAVEQTDVLRKEILDGINGQLHEFQAKEVYIVEFLVQ